MDIQTDPKINLTRKIVMINWRVEENRLAFVFTESGNRLTEW